MLILFLINLTKTPQLLLTSSFNYIQRMTLSCTLFGHKYGGEELEERKEKQDGKMAVVEVSKRTCDRCGNELEEKVRTRIVENSEDSVSTQPTEETSGTNVTNRKSRNRGRTSNDSTGLGTSKKDYIDDEADGGVILTDNDSDSNSEGSKHQSSSDSSHTTGFTDGDVTERTVKDDEGVVVLEQDGKQEGPEGSNGYAQDESPTEYRIICESCTYTDVDVETSRRDGDLCPECGGWLEVKHITDTEPHSEK